MRCQTLIGNVSGNQFTVITSCTCTGYKKVYECKVTGDGSTVWKGTAFDCPSSGNQINLLHSQFVQTQGTDGVCNRGGIVANNIGATTNRTYTSQLVVNLTMVQEGESVECFHDNTTSLNFIGNASIRITEGKTFYLYSIKVA